MYQPVLCHAGVRAWKTFQVEAKTTHEGTALGSVLCDLTHEVISPLPLNARTSHPSSLPLWVGKCLLYFQCSPPPPLPALVPEIHVRECLQETAAAAHTFRDHAVPLKTLQGENCGAQSQAHLRHSSVHNRAAPLSTGTETSLHPVTTKGVKIQDNAMLDSSLLYLISGKKRLFRIYVNFRCFNELGIKKQTALPQKCKSWVIASFPFYYCSVLSLAFFKETQELCLLT